jgi:hypothetical protein
MRARDWGGVHSGAILFIQGVPKYANADRVGHKFQAKFQPWIRLFHIVALVSIVGRTVLMSKKF